MSQTGHQVRFMDEPALSIKAGYAKVIGAPDRILIGNTWDLEEEALQYLIAHEFAHSLLNHGRQVMELVAPSSDKGLPDAELWSRHGKAALLDVSSAMRQLNHQQEFEADEFAVRQLVLAGADVKKAMKGVLQNQSSSFSHPSRRERLTRAEAVAKRTGEAEGLALAKD